MSQQRLNNNYVNGAPIVSGWGMDRTIRRIKNEKQGERG